MDFDKTSFSVDWYTPGEKYAPKRLSFPKSARISMDDFVPDSPLSFCFSPVDPRPSTYSLVDSPFETARGWTTSAPPSPLVSHPLYDPDPKMREESAMDWRAFATPGLLSIADDCVLCGVDLDVSCLDALDEQLLVAPLECFSELCWAAAVHDEVTASVPRRSDPPLASRDDSGGFERTRPLATRITVVPSPTCEPHATCPNFKEKPLAYFPDTDPEGGFLSLSVQGVPMPRRPKKRDQTLTRSLEPAPSHLQPSKSSQTLRVISDAYSTLTRARKKPPH